MSRKNILKPFKIAPAQSLATSFNTAATIVAYADNISYQVNVATSDSSGTFSIQVSDDYTIDEVTNTITNTGNWITLPLSGSPTAAGVNDSILIDVNQLPHNAIRMSYTPSVAGTGTCDVYIMHRQQGG